ncbi:hypothetical protein DPMN_150564 [Dreissena polymorpha]|uniref:Uncharacterized protein n=1 Tax=Dreissena polymorpha TaxID=45954 RepID=A0A9D4FDN3_DREPO|nr:hypothetical protein DPMN_150564 [Dreissena polymorpha]
MQSPRLIISTQKFKKQKKIQTTRNGAAEANGGAPRLVMGPCIVEIDRFVIREVQYQLEVNRCRNKEVIVKGNFGWVWSMWAGRPRIDRIVIREVQYQFEVNPCRNEEVNFQGSSANSVGGDRIDDDEEKEEEEQEEEEEEDDC